MNNYQDAMITIALDRQAEKVRRVQAYGLPALSGQMDKALPSRATYARTAPALVAAFMVIGGLLLAYVVR